LSTDDPAGQPYVVAVGGTTVTINSSSNAYVSETVWNHDGFGTGGGLSQNWARPSWQTGPGTTNAYSNGKREVPDIAAPGDPNTGYVVFSGGAWTVIGGTSGAAPFLAAGFALVNQAYVAREGRRIGFTSPSLYRLLAGNVGAFRDVTVGNNCTQAAGECVTAGSIYPATAAFDLTTGVGTPKFAEIAANLVPPNSLPSSQPTVSPVSGGNPLPTSRPAGPPVGGATPAPLPSPRP
jgi:kumamolisin